MIDTSGTIPRLVRDSAGLLPDACEHYIYVSSISAYSDFRWGAIEETSPLARLPAGASTEEVPGDNFGALKALCEKEVRRRFESATVVRSGLSLDLTTGRIVSLTGRTA